MNKGYYIHQVLTIKDDVSYDTIMIFDRTSQKREIVSTTHQKFL